MIAMLNTFLNFHINLSQNLASFKSLLIILMVILMVGQCFHMLIINNNCFCEKIKFSNEICLSEVLLKLTCANFVLS